VQTERTRASTRGVESRKEVYKGVGGRKETKRREEEEEWRREKAGGRF